MRILGFLFLAIVVIVVLMALGGGGSGIPQTCEELAPRIIELSEDDDLVSILKLSSIRKIENTEYALECSAAAKMSRGGDSTISFYIEQDEDGDMFYGYQPQ